MADRGLEIYHLDVVGGDATAILVKDLAKEKETGGETIYSMLIDAGSEGSGSAYLKTYLKAHKMGPFDCIVATHYHQDHINGFQPADIKFKSFIDIGGYAHKTGEPFKNRNGIGDGADTAVFSSYKAQVQSQVEKNSAARIPIPFIEKEFKGKAEPLIHKLSDTGITLTCYCANGILADGTDVLGSQKKTKQKGISPNDVSLAMILEWGDFRYFTGGDLSGDELIKAYYDIEPHLLKYLDEGPLKGKKITVFKASHHGSEHSNKTGLLNRLSPETIVTSCNMQKQVPSPIFLERLNQYFTTNATAVAVFTNTMKVFKNDDRYSKLESIKSSIADGNVAFSGTGNEERIASNLGIKCAIIRRRMREDKYEDYPDSLVPSTKIKIIKKNGYEIVLMPRDKDEAKTIEATVKFKSYTISQSWDPKECSKEDIEDGFKALAKKMAGWIEGKNAEVGRAYIQEHYPSLIKTLDKAGDKVANLVEEMKRMFGESFVIKLVGWWGPKKSNQLTSDEKMTFYAIMVNNSYQDKFNRVADIDYRGLEDTWNRSDYREPDFSAGIKRKLGDGAPAGRGSGE
jgi:beta-lactamase superfamily II metal-dependent hydrolase